MTLGNSTRNNNTMDATEGACTPQHGNVAIGNSRKRSSAGQPVHARDGGGAVQVDVDNGKRGRQQPTNEGWGETFKSRENFVQMHMF
ncbi:hypothetical protein LSAT2_002863 [Lamellibrachia satsuma]|nr:hypothetical protein LSAT2_002863 [Lamellibrachia satsuma]